MRDHFFPLTYSLPTLCPHHAPHLSPCAFHRIIYPHSPHPPLPPPMLTQLLLPSALALPASSLSSHPHTALTQHSHTPHTIFTRRSPSDENVFLLRQCLRLDPYVHLALLSLSLTQQSNANSHVPPHKNHRTRNQLTHTPHTQHPCTQHPNTGPVCLHRGAPDSACLLNFISPHE